MEGCEMGHFVGGRVTGYKRKKGVGWCRLVVRERVGADALRNLGKGEGYRGIDCLERL